MLSEYPDTYKYFDVLIWNEVVLDIPISKIPHPVLIASLSGGHASMFPINQAENRAIFYHRRHLRLRLW